MLIVALDPGTLQTGFVVVDRGCVVHAGVRSNEDTLDWLKTTAMRNSDDVLIAIEMVASYGMPVGREVFETVRWIGRFQQAWRDPESVVMVYRRDVKLHLCGSARAKDPNVRQAIVDLFPATGGGAKPQFGTKAKPGPLYGVTSHAMSALAVALYVQAQQHKAAA